MGFDVKRVVTRIDDQGKAVFAEVAAVEPVTTPAMPGLAWYRLWGTDDEPTTPQSDPRPVHDPWVPKAPGTRIFVTKLPPDAEAHDPGMAPDEILAMTEEALPGLIGNVELGEAGFHATPTIDYVIVVEGEVFLELDDGEEVCLPVGSCVIQNGTRHAWRNKGDAPAKLLTVFLGAHKAT